MAEECFSSMNDSDETDEERVNSMKTGQITNVLKGYASKLEKWQ